jgi:hypothetical protein
MLDALAHLLTRTRWVSLEVTGRKTGGGGNDMHPSSEASLVLAKPSLTVLVLICRLLNLTVAHDCLVSLTQ